MNSSCFFFAIDHSFLFLASVHLTLIPSILANGHGTAPVWRREARGSRVGTHREDGREERSTLEADRLATLPLKHLLHGSAAHIIAATVS
jgi:hypothetical protein